MESFENLDEVFVLICCVWCIMARHLHFWSRLSRAHCSWSLVVFTDPTLQHYKKSCYHELSPASPRKQAILDLFLIALSCTSTFNELTEACKVWAIDLGGFFSSFSEHSLIWPWSGFAGTSTARKIVALCSPKPECSGPANCQNLLTLVDDHLIKGTWLRAPSISLWKQQDFTSFFTGLQRDFWKLFFTWL